MHWPWFLKAGRERQPPFLQSAFVGSRIRMVLVPEPVDGLVPSLSRPTSSHAGRAERARHRDALIGAPGPLALHPWGMLFSGTSGATPIVTSAAAPSQASTTVTRNHAVPTPATVRSVLKFTGTPQNTSTISGNIGPLPNLDAALLATDNRPPIITKVTPLDGATGVAGEYSGGCRVQRGDEQARH